MSDFVVIFSAVFFANLASLVCFMCYKEMARHRADRDVPGWSMAGFVVPLLFGALALYLVK